MNQQLLSLCVLAAATLTLAAGRTAYGQKNRSWVANYGSDGSPCTLASPCLTLERAHDNTNAGGEVDVLTPGDYGTVVITKAITIDGGTFASIEVGINRGAAITVSAGSSDTVVLRNLSITGLPGLLDTQGINFSRGKKLSVENVVLSGIGNGVSVSTSALSELVIKDTVIRGSYAGVYCLPQSGSRPAVTRDNVAKEDK